MSVKYDVFLESKRQIGGQHGFKPKVMPKFLYDFQAELVDWGCYQGMAAILAGTGLGKTAMQSVWAENVRRHTGKPVLVLTPLSVSHQFVSECEKFGMEAARSVGGEIKAGLVATNYERLHMFKADDFGGVVCDESSILKNFDGARKAQITEFMRRLPYRLLCTATPAPNDYIELGTSSEALGGLGYMDMLGMFFKNDQNSLHPTSGRGRFEGGALTQDRWRFKPHAERPFWRWVCSWARALTKPSDLNPEYNDKRFELPPLEEREHVITRKNPLPGFLFNLPAVGLSEQRADRKETLNERCEKVAEIINAGKGHSVAWCHLNPEGDLLERLIPDAVQVSGKDSDDEKEAKLKDFSEGRTRVLITKPVIAGFGLNWQHCSHMTFFPSHSFEQYFQGVRRCWRFGQTKPVTVDLVTGDGESGVLANLRRKDAAARRMMEMLVEEMRNEYAVSRDRHNFNQKMEVPKWK